MRMTRYLETQRSLAGGGGGSDGYTAATQAAAVADALRRASGFRRLVSPSTGTSGAQDTWTDADGRWSISLTAGAAHADPSAGAWRSWPAVTPDGHPVDSEWSGALQVLPDDMHTDVDMLVGYADGPLDTATIAVLWGCRATGAGRPRAVIWVLENATWTRTEGGAPASTYPVIAARGTMGWRGNQGGIDPSESIDHMTRLVEEDGRMLNNSTFDASSGGAIGWGAIFEAAGQLHQVVCATATGAVSSVPISARLLTSLQGHDHLAGLEQDVLSTVLFLILGQSNGVGFHNEGTTGVALPSLDLPVASSHIIVGEGRADDGEHSAGPSNAAAGIRDGSSGAQRRIVIESAEGSQDVDDMIAIHLPALVTAVRDSGWPDARKVGIYLQGESDAVTQPKANAFQSKLESLIATSRTEMGADLIWYLVKISATISGLPGKDTVNAAMDNIAAADALVEVVETSPSQLTSDGIHLTAQALYDIGLDVRQRATVLGICTA